MKIIERAVIFLFALIAALCIGWVFVIGITQLFDANGWKRMSAADWGTWVGSIGTFGVLLGAIWIATQDRRRQQRYERDLAVITAGKIYVPLSACRDELAYLRDQLIDRRDNGVPINAQASAANLTALRRIETDDLLRMVVLPHHVAAKLAAAEGVIDHIARKLQVANALVIGTAAYNRIIDSLLVHVEFAVESFSLGQEECKKYIKSDRPRAV